MTAVMPVSNNASEVWAIYARVSTRHQAEEGFSLDNQKDTLTSYAGERAWSWKLFEDAGISGETLDNRPGMVAMLEEADRGGITGVLVVDESRLARDEFIAALIRQRLKSAGVRVATPGRGEYNLADPADNFAANVLAAAHAFEQDIRTAKMRAGLRRAAEAGYWTGGPPPYGYRLEPSLDGHHKVLVIDEDQAAVLRLLFDLIVIQGHTTYSAAKYLNANGYRTVKGRQWRHENICFRLRQHYTAGTWTYKHGEEPIRVSIPPIFTTEEWERLQRSIKGRPRPLRRNRLYPLTGRGRVHLRCSCGGNYFGMTDSGKKNRSYYKCSRNTQSFGEDRCQLRPRITRAPILEDTVWRVVSDLLTDTAYLTALAVGHIAEHGEPSRSETLTLERRLTRLRTEETNIVRALAGIGDLSDDVLRPALEEVTSERHTVEKELSRLAALGQQFPDMATLEQQIRHLSTIAQERLADPSPELMAEVFDLLELDLIRIDGRLYEGVGRLPLPTDDGAEEGEVCTEGPPDLGLRRR